MTTSEIRNVLRPFKNGARFVLRRRDKEYTGFADDTKVLGNKIIVSCSEISRNEWLHPLFNCELEFFDWKKVEPNGNSVLIIDGPHSLQLFPKTG